MAMSTSSGDDQPLSDINVTPLVDVMLVLLVIFIILAPMFAQALRVELPRVNAPATTEPVVLDLTVLDDGALLLDGATTDPAALPAALQARVVAQPELVVRLHAGAQTPYQRVAEVMGRVQAAGVTRLAFATQPGP